MPKEKRGNNNRSKASLTAFFGEKAWGKKALRAKAKKKGEKMEEENCGKECQVYSRVVGYFRPVQMWNDGKREEFRERLEFNQKKALEKELPNLLKKTDCAECTATARK